MSKEEFIDEIVKREVVHMHVDYWQDKCFISVKYKDGSTEELEVNK